MCGAAVLFATFLVSGVEWDKTPLVKTFGYNNMCVNWDYEPSTTLTALIYPVVEVPLLIYVFTSQFKFHTHPKVSATMRTLVFCSGVLQFFLAVTFRLIFVENAFLHTLLHTVPFMGLQVGLVLIALQNHYYRYHITNPLKGDRKILSHFYLFSLVAVTAAKLFLNTNIFLGNFVVSTMPSVGMAGEWLDRFWMILAAFVPMLLAIYIRATDPTGVVSVVITNVN